MIHSSWMAGWLTDGQTEEPNWWSNGSITKRHHPKPECVGVFEWVAASHILLIHLVHLGNDSLTFALEENGKIGNVFSQIQTLLTSHVLCFFKAEHSKYLTHIATAKRLLCFILIGFEQDSDKLSIGKFPRRFLSQDTAYEHLYSM